MGLNVVLWVVMIRCRLFVLMGECKILKLSDVVYVISINCNILMNLYYDCVIWIEFLVVDILCKYFNCNM